MASTATEVGVLTMRVWLFAGTQIASLVGMIAVTIADVVKAGKESRIRMVAV